MKNKSISIKVFRFSNPILIKNLVLPKNIPIKVLSELEIRRLK